MKYELSKDIYEMFRKLQVKELVEYERYCRDQSLFDEMTSCFLNDSRVEITWFEGSGKEFAIASSKMRNKAPHKLNNSLVWLNGNKAVAIVMGSIKMRTKIDNNYYDLNSDVRFVYSCVYQDDRWYIKKMTAIYEKDSLVKVNQDWVRTSYANLAKGLMKSGYNISEDLAGEDRPETVEKLLKETTDWLNY